MAALTTTTLDPPRLTVRERCRIADIRTGGGSPRSEELFAALTGSRPGLDALCAAVKRLHVTNDRERPGEFIRSFVSMADWVSRGEISAADVVSVFEVEAASAEFSLALEARR